MKMPEKRIEPLSNYPSEAILQVIDDMRTIESTPNWGIDMSTWVSLYRPRNYKSFCTACMAGSVMMREPGSTYGSAKFKVLPEDFKVKGMKGEELDLLKDQIKSFNNLREGYVEAFAWDWINGREISNFIFAHESTMDKLHFQHVIYDKNPEEFYRWCRKVASFFKRAGY